MTDLRPHAHYSRVLKVLFALTLALPFYRLGLGEILPWDEALYAVRVNAILRFGAWWDQTSYAVGGLYSSTHPPLAVWFMAASVQMLGESVWAMRLVSAVCGAAGVCFFFKLAREFVSKEAAIIGAIAFGNAQVWLWYSHHAQLDVPRDCLLLASAYVFVRGLNEIRPRPGLAGALFGAALMVKAFQACYLLPLFLWIAWEKRAWHSLARFAIAAVLVALPWYGWMAFRHPEFLSGQFLLASQLESGTYRSSQSHYWYYLNQLVVAIPLVLVLPFLRPISRTHKMLLIWLLASVLLLMLVRTAMPHFVLFLLIPAALAVSHAAEKEKVSTWGLLLAGLGLFWSGSEVLRLWIRTGDYSHMFISSPPLAVVLLGCSFVLVFARWTGGSQRALLLILTLLVSSNIYRWASRSERAFQYGANAVVKAIDSLKLDRLAYVYRGDAHDSLAPQFAYYSDGMNLGWQRGRTVTPIESANLGETTLNDFRAAVRYDERDAFNRETRTTRADSLLAATFPNQLRFSRYTLFTR